MYISTIKLVDFPHLHIFYVYLHNKTGGFSTYLDVMINTQSLQILINFSILFISPLNFWHYSYTFLRNDHLDCDIGIFVLHFMEYITHHAHARNNIDTDLQVKLQVKNSPERLLQ
jgi:hypothetical protein